MEDNTARKLGTEPFNPYAAPTGAAPVVQNARRGELAEPSTRLGARMLDTLLMVAAFAPGLILATLLVVPSSADGTDSSQHSAAGMLIVALGGFGVLGLVFYQWWLVATTGQSLGKRWLRIRIVTSEGDAPGFWRGVFLRSWVIAVLGAIPMLGSLISLVNALMVFSDGRRCLHDRIAGTSVLKD